VAISMASGHAARSSGARTAADEHGVAHIEAMTQQARAIQSAFREP
jgi:hypothetical protein